MSSLISGSSFVFDNVYSGLAFFAPFPIIFCSFFTVVSRLLLSLLAGLPFSAESLAGLSKMVYFGGSYLVNRHYTDKHSLDKSANH